MEIYIFDLLFILNTIKFQKILNNKIFIKLN